MVATFFFWFCLATLGYVYVGYLAVIRLMAFWVPIRHEVRESHLPTVTVLFSAYNEQASLPAKLESLRGLNYPPDQLQILVASDASDDGTSEWLLEQDDVEAVILEERSGKNAALNRLLPRARGDLLFFTDANTILHPDCLKNSTRHFADPRVGMVTGQLVFTHDVEWNPVGRGTGLYWRYENAIKQAENRLGSVLVGSGSVLMVRRDLVPRLEPRIANDLEVPTRVGAAGYRVLFEPASQGYEKPHTDAEEELLRTSRIVSRGLRGFVVLLPVMARSPFRLWQFISHKALRWITLPLGLGLLVAASGLDHTVARGVLGAGLLALGISLVGVALTLLKVKTAWSRPFTLPGHLLLMYTGALWGLILAVLGKTPAAWSLPSSSR